MANINNFNFQSPSVFNIPEGEGFTNGTIYTDPGTEDNTRKQLQTQHSQIKKYINETLVTEVNSKEERIADLEDTVDELETNEITNITSDGTFQISKVGKVYNLSLSVTPEGVTKQYVDEQDQIIKSEAEEYADDNLAEAKEYAEEYTDTKESGIKQNTLGGLTYLSLSQTEYDALTTKDPSTIYFVYED